jgi:hypothetical protein
MAKARKETQQRKIMNLNEGLRILAILLKKKARGLSPVGRGQAALQHTK